MIEASRKCEQTSVEPGFESMTVSITSITQELSMSGKGKYFAFFGLKFQCSLSSNLRVGYDSHDWTGANREIHLVSSPEY
jgi:hypothetical protein